MKRAPFLSLALLLAFMMPAIQQVHAAAQQVDGIVSDSMCARKHMLPGKSAAQCTNECIKRGANYALVTKDKVYTLAGKPAPIAPFAGKHVHVQGSIKGNVINVTAMHEAMAGMPSGMRM